MFLILGRLRAGSRDITVVAVIVFQRTYLKVTSSFSSLTLSVNLVYHRILMLWLLRNLPGTDNCRDVFLSHPLLRPSIIPVHAYMFVIIWSCVLLVPSLNSGCGCGAVTLVTRSLRVYIRFAGWGCIR